MSNASAITVNNLAANSSLTDPTPDALDTGTSAVTLNAAIAGAADRCYLRVKNTDDDTALTVAVLAGDNPPAQRAGVGALSVTVAFGATKWIGPLDPARFLQDDGSINVTFTPASGTIAAQVTCFIAPRVV